MLKAEPPFRLRRPCHPRPLPPSRPARLGSARRGSGRPLGRSRAGSGRAQRCRQFRRKAAAAAGGCRGMGLPAGMVEDPRGRLVAELLLRAGAAGGILCLCSRAFVE